MALPKITESMIRAGAGPESSRRGEEYNREGAISNTAVPILCPFTILITFLFSFFDGILIR